MIFRRKNKLEHSAEALPPPLIMALEPRILLDGAAVADAVNAVTDHDYADDSDTDNAAVTNEAVEAAPTQTSRREVVFVDTALPDVDTLIDGLPADAEVFLIEAHEDGLKTIAELLQAQTDIDAIHILGHAEAGIATIGDSILSNATLSEYQELLKDIAESLTEEGDMLFYGCNLAASEDGVALVENIATLTGADIAASNDLTGAGELGGDWDLEVEKGSIETKGFDIAPYDSTLITTGSNINEGDATGINVVNGTDLSSEIAAADYGDGSINISISGDSIPQEYIAIGANANTGNLSFIGGKIFDGINRVGNYYENRSYISSPVYSYFTKNIDIDLGNTFYNGTFRDNTTGWNTNLNNSSDPKAESMSHTVGVSSQQLRFNGSGRLNTAGDFIEIGSFNSTESLSLTADNHLSFTFRGTNSSGGSYTVNAYLEATSGGADYSLINAASYAQNSVTNTFSADLTGLVDGEYRFVVEMSIEDDVSVNEIIAWDLYFDSIKVTQNTATSIDESTVEKIANAINYSLSSAEQLRAYETSTDLNKSIRIQTNSSKDSISNDFNADFTVTPVNDQPYSSYSANGTINRYSTPGYEIDIFGSINISPVESAQNISSITLTVDGINQPNDEFLIYNSEILRLSDGTGTFDGKNYTVTTATDPGDADRIKSTIVIEGNWTTTSNLYSNTYSSTLNTFLNNLKFRNNAINTIDDKDRVVTLTTIIDSGENSVNDDNSLSPNYTGIIRRIPVLTVADSTFDEAASVPITAAATLDIDDSDEGLASTVSIVSATLRITEGYTDGDTLSFNSADPRFIVTEGLDDDGLHFITLTSNPDNDAILLVSEWETALMSITFDTDSDYPNENPTRTLKWEINDGLPRYIPEYSTITIIEEDDLISLPQGAAALTTPHNENVLLDLSNYFYDPDDTLTFSESNLPTGLSLNTSTGLLTGKLITNGPAAFTATITAANSRPDSQSITLNITVTDDNINITGTQPDLIISQNATAPFNISGYFADSDDTLHYDASNLPGGLSINQSTGQITGTAEPIADTELTDGKKVYTVTVTAFSFELDTNGDETSTVKSSETITFDITISKESLSLTPWSGFHFDSNGNPIAQSGLYQSQNPNETSPTYAAAGTVVPLFREASSASLTQGENYSEFSLKISNVNIFSNEFIIADGSPIRLIDNNAGNLLTNNGQTVHFDVTKPDSNFIIKFNGAFNSEQLNDFLESLSYRNDSATTDINAARFISISNLNQSDGDSTQLELANVTVKRLPVFYISDYRYAEGNSPTTVSDNIYLRNIPANAALFSATVEISENLQPGEFLGFGGLTDYPSISSSFNAESGILTITSPTALFPSNWEPILSAVKFVSNRDYDSSEDLRRTITWQIHGDPNGIELYQPQESRIDIRPVLGLMNDSIAVDNNYSKDAFKSFSNFGSSLTYAVSGLPQTISIDPQTGVISGSATPTGEYNVRVSIITPDGETAFDDYKLTIYPISSGSDNSGETASNMTNNNATLSGLNNSPSTQATNNYNNNLAQTSPTDSGASDTSFKAPSKTSPTTSNTDENSSTESPTDPTNEGLGDGTVPAENTPFTDPTTASEASLNTVENADATINAIFDPAPPDNYDANLTESNPPGFDSIKLAIDDNGQLQIVADSTIGGETGISGMTIVDIEQNGDQLSVLISDININGVANYSASLADGKPLPNWLTLDPVTGQISGDIPAGADELEIILQAIDADGSIRSLDIQLDLKTLPEQPLSLNLDIEPAGLATLSAQITALQMREQLTTEALAGFFDGSRPPRG